MRTTFWLRCPGRFSRVMVAWAMVLAPLAATQAQKPNPPVENAATLDTTWITPQSVAVGYLRPPQILSAEGAELLPIEIFNAAAKKYLGIEAADIESITFVISGPLPGQPHPFAYVLTSTKPLSLAGLSPEITSQTEPAELYGVQYLKGTNDDVGSFYVHEGTTLIAGLEPMLQEMLRQAKEPASGPLAAALKNRPATDDLYVAVDVKSLRPQLEAALAEAAAEVPPPFQKYFGAIDLVRSAEFAFNLSQPKPPLLSVYANDAAAAEELAQLVDEGTAEAREQMAAQMAVNPTDDPVEKAMMAYGLRRTEATLEMLRPVVSGDKLTFFPTDPNDPNQRTVQMQQIAVMGILVALLLPAVQAAREAARRNDSTAPLRQLAIAMQNYHDTNGKFPAHASYSDDGKPLLSWRVHLLPFLENQPLYREFHLDEPWDSEHNKQLIARMPEVFQSPNAPLDRADGKTLFLAPVGEGYFFDGTKDAVGIRQLTDGTSKTIMIVEANPDKAVIWTKPDDLTIDADNPLAGLGKLRTGIFLAAFADGRVSPVAADIQLDLLKALFTRAGGEPIPNDF